MLYRVYTKLMSLTGNLFHIKLLLLANKETSTDVVQGFTLYTPVILQTEPNQCKYWGVCYISWPARKWELIFFYNASST